MQESSVSLEKKAIKAGVAMDWALAKELNQEILKGDPKNIDARSRLGKACLELKEYPKAAKYFKEVLEIDPLNQTALKNLSLAKEKKTSKSNGVAKSNIILEPGTYAETSIEITAKRYKAESFTKGQVLFLKQNHKTIKVNYTKNDGTLVEIGELNNENIIRKIISAKKEKIDIKATYLKGHDKSGAILVIAESPIFEAERQDVKPYMKRDFIEDSSENVETVIED